MSEMSKTEWIHFLIGFTAFIAGVILMFVIVYF